MTTQRPHFMTSIDKAKWLYENQSQINENDKKFLQWYRDQVRGNFGDCACSGKFK